MKINDNRITTPQAAASRAAKDVEKASIEKLASESIGKQASTKVAGANPGATALTFDAKRVEELKLAIANGTFEVNPERIADGLIKSIEANLSRNKQ